MELIFGYFILTFCIRKHDAHFWFGKGSRNEHAHGLVGLLLRAHAEFRYSLLGEEWPNNTNETPRAGGKSASRIGCSPLHSWEEVQTETESVTAKPKPNEGPIQAQVKDPS